LGAFSAVAKDRAATIHDNMTMALLLRSTGKRNRSLGDFDHQAFEKSPKNILLTLNSYPSFKNLTSSSYKSAEYPTHVKNGVSPWI
jgi:hypothetical protein